MLASAAPEQVKHTHMAPALLFVAFGELYSPHSSQCSTRAISACTYSSGISGCSIWGSCIALMLASAAPEQVQHTHMAPALLVAAFGIAVYPSC